MTIKQLLWQRSGGYWMFWSGAVYFAVGTYCIFVNSFIPVWTAQVLWIAALAFPFTYPPFGRWLNMNITWDKGMFNFFKNKPAEDTPADNVVQFPEPKSVPPMPEVKPPKEPEKPATTYYRLGLTSDNRVSLTMGYSEITMNATGIDNMIKQLEVFRDQLLESEDDNA